MAGGATTTGASSPSRKRDKDDTEGNEASEALQPFGWGIEPFFRRIASQPCEPQHVVGGLLLGTIVLIFNIISSELIFGQHDSLKSFVGQGVSMHTLTGLIGGIFAVTFSSLGISISACHIYNTVGLSLCFLCFSWCIVHSIHVTLTHWPEKKSPYSSFLLPSGLRSSSRVPKT